MHEAVCEVVFVDLNGGCWGLTDEAGNQWRPEVFPRELQQQGLRVSCTFEISEDDFSVFMWGTPVVLVSCTPIPTL